MKDSSSKQVKSQQRGKPGWHECLRNNAPQSGATPTTFWGKENTFQEFYTQPSCLSSKKATHSPVCRAHQTTCMSLSGENVLLKNLKWKKNIRKAKMWLKIKIKKRKGRQVGRKNWGCEQTLFKWRAHSRFPCELCFCTSMKCIRPDKGIITFWGTV